MDLTDNEKEVVETQKEKLLDTFFKEMPEKELTEYDIERLIEHILTCYLEHIREWLRRYRSFSFSKYENNYNIMGSIEKYVSVNWQNKIKKIMFPTDVHLKIFQDNINILITDIDKTPSVYNKEAYNKLKNDFETLCKKHCPHSILKYNIENDLYWIEKHTIYDVHVITRERQKGCLIC
jgi:hypothetical protein